MRLSILQYSPIRSDKKLTLAMSVFQIFHGGNSCMIKPNFHISLNTTDAAPQFLQVTKKFVKCQLIDNSLRTFAVYQHELFFAWLVSLCSSRLIILINSAD